MFDKNVQIEALERMVEFYTKGGNVAEAEKAKADLLALKSEVEVESQPKKQVKKSKSA